MDLPEAVQRQAEEAEKLEQQLYGQPAQAPEAPVEEAQPAEQKPVEEQSAEPVAQEDVDLKNALEKANARYSSLRGMYQADNNRARQQIEDMNKRIAEQDAELAKLKAQLAVKETPKTSEADKEQFGEEMFDFVKRAAQEEAHKHSVDRAQLENEIQTLRNRLDNSEAERVRTSRGAFLQELTNYLPDWQVQDKDPAFIQWLSEPDSFSGISRQEILGRAVSGYDARKAAEIFVAYRKVLQAKQKPLAKQVAPTHSRSAPPSTDVNAGKRIWTEQDIKAFYTAVRRGEYTQEKVAEIEKDLDAAIAEGRYKQ